MYGIKANIRAPHRFMRMGALCWIVNTNPGSGGENVEVVGMSRGGRTVRTWISARDLTNFRVAWAHDESNSLHESDREKLKGVAALLSAEWASKPVRAHAAAYGKQ